MVQRRQYRIAPAPGERDNEKSDEGSPDGETIDDRREDVTASGGAREGQATLLEAGMMVKGGAINNLRTSMEDMEVG